MRAKRLIGGLLIGLAGVPTAATAQAQLVFGQTYSCADGAQQLVVKSCKRAYTFETCEVQYLNSAAPSGLGAQTDVRKEMLQQQLATCRVAGAPVRSVASAGGRPGQALSLGTWHDVTILGREGDEVRVRWSSGTEDLMPADKVRENAGAAPPPSSPRARGGGEAIRAGKYACTSFIGPVTGGGHMVPMPGFTVTAGGAYVHQHGSRGTIGLGGDGAAVFKGGALDGQAAKYEPSSGGHAVLRLYNERRSRTVIDCQGPPA